jgi:membrane-bound lytic murein transglycosylase A
MLALILVLLPALSEPPALARLPPERWPHFFETGDPARLEAALELQAGWYARQPPDRTWPLGEGTVTAARLRATCLELLAIVRARQNPALALRDRFDLYFATGARDTGRAVFTGYHNPVVEARLAPDSVFRYPLYRPPPHPHRDRRAIEEQDALAGKDLEIAWLRDPFDRYDVHVEGSATLRLADGSTINAHYAGHNGHPYTSLGGELIRAGLLDPDRRTAGAIRELLSARPEGHQPWFNRNRRYIYFRLSPGPPAGAAGIPLIPGRSVATDHAVFPPGIPCWAALRLPLPESAATPGPGRAWAGFLLNHDVGAAIRGPERVDIYWGTGDSAAALAGQLHHPGRFYAIVLKQP